MNDLKTNSLTREEWSELVNLFNDGLFSKAELAIKYNVSIGDITGEVIRVSTLKCKEEKDGNQR